MGKPLAVTAYNLTKPQPAGELDSPGSAFCQNI